MQSKKNKLFKINDFAKLCGTNRKTLIYYDTIGLFSPIYKDDKGYRYYSYHQYDILSIIFALKEIDMPLSSIKHFIENRSPNLLIETLSNQQLLLNNRIEKLKQVSKLIENVITSTSRALDTDFNQIYISYQESEKIILSKKITNNSNSGIFKTISSLINSYYEKNISNSYGLGAIILEENLKARNYTNIDYLFLEYSEYNICEDIFVKPAGEYVTAYHQGKYKDSSITYNKILKFINENYYKIAGNSYELEILNNISQSNEDDYITKICIQVRKI